ncbi:MAG TPA: hypothetical protein H9876_05700 [Candidatus Limosilactobacillus merdipullorum]|uniref:PepSY domain-containing protein n=1 Tax=Candidatus Limosilactobacillus merdipullorum TaxID=2838653 RepID=A0A9D1QRG8_9LACO|nr:hypothetical protein [Candidatus Limosilactobacillus merdipullorum]
MNNSLISPWKVSATLGLSSIAGFVLGQLIGSRKQSANHILKMIKHDFKKEGPVIGSWVDTHAVPYQRYAVKADVYHGGITRLEDGHPVNYRFTADAHTGSLIELKRDN